MLLLILTLGLENTQTNWSCTDSALIEEKNIKKTADIENTSCVRSVMKETPVSRIEI